MNFEQPNLEPTTDKKPETVPLPESEVNLSPSMQELYENIIGEEKDEEALESEARKMSAAERMSVLGRAINRAGKLARRIAVVAFAAFTPSLAGSIDSVKAVENNLKNETEKEWSNVKAEKSSLKEERLNQEKMETREEKMKRVKNVIEASNGGTGLSPLETYLSLFKYGDPRGNTCDGLMIPKGDISEEDVRTVYDEVAKNYEDIEGVPAIPTLDYDPQTSKEIMAIIHNVPVESEKGVEQLFEEYEIVKAYRKGLFKNHEEYLKWLKTVDMGDK